jgi:hypothetical protein
VARSTSDTATGEDEPVRQHPVLRHERPHHVVVARHDIGAADEDEPVTLVDVALVVLGEPDVIFDLLVGCDAPNEEEVVMPVVQDGLERRAREAPG